MITAPDLRPKSKSESRSTGELAPDAQLEHQFTDHELLELAAKAAGVELKYDTFGQSENADRVYNYWNPLNDDGDALRLAVKIGFIVNAPSPIGTHASVKFYDIEVVEMIKDRSEECRRSATRRAIVRSAAEISKGMLTQDEFVLMFPGRFDEEAVDRAANAIGKATP